MDIYKICHNCNILIPDDDEINSFDRCYLCEGELERATAEEIEEYKRKEAQEKKEQVLRQMREDYIKSYTPKCPVCGSPNIHKISTTKRVISGAAFGLFSKTARSQWECSNCGNKF